MGGRILLDCNPFCGKMLAFLPKVNSYQKEVNVNERGS